MSKVSEREEPVVEWLQFLIAAVIVVILRAHPRLERRGDMDLQWKLGAAIRIELRGPACRSSV